MPSRFPRPLARLVPPTLSLLLALLALALAPAALAAAPAPELLAEGPSVWRDGVWQPLDAGVEVAPVERAAAFASAAAAATNEGSQIRAIVPLSEADGSAEVAVFGATVDGETCLWRTDGTAAGTFRVEPEGGCLQVQPTPFVAIADGIAYFIGEPNAPRYWRTDGTAAGTWPLTSFSDSGLFGGSISFFPVPPLGLVLFVANDGVHGPELWVSDGGPENAQRLAAPGLDGFPFRFQILGSEVLFFVFRDGVEYELWKTDGTAAGTSLVEVVGSEEFGSGPRSAYLLGERVVFFLGSVQACVVELWATDGTAAGTEPIRSFDGPSCSISGQFQATTLAAFPGEVFFAADDGTHGGELWRTDGTAAGTVRLTDFAPAQPFPTSFPLNFRPVALGGAIYFAADDGIHGMELWKSDGTPGGASLVADLCPGACGSSPGPLQVVGGRLVFSAETPAAGRELWTSDGTAAGTQRVTDLCPGPCGANIFREVPFGDSLLFIADDGTNGQEWWIFTPSAGPAVRLTDLAPAQPFGTFLNMVPLDGRAVFTADDGVHGREPWVTDGTPPGTHLLVDLETTEIPPPPDPPAAPTGLTIEKIDGGRVFLSWEDNSVDETLFRFEILRAGAVDWQTAGHTSADVTSLEGQFGLGIFDLRVRAVKHSGVEVVSAPSNVVTATVGGFCFAEQTDLCLGDDRFAVRVQWRNQHAPVGEINQGQGQAVPAGGGVDDSGYFWFFTPDNLELVVKVLDGRAVNGHFWVFWGALSDVEYSIVVEDTVTFEQRLYHNPPGRICGGADTAAFPDEVDASRFAHAGATARGELGATQPAARPEASRSFAVASGPATRFVALDAPASIAGETHPPVPCFGDDDTLCLLDGLLSVSVDWTDHHNGGSGIGHAIPYTDLTGFFWFFDEENVELVVKALDGRTVNGKIWVFYGALTDVGFTLRVEYDAAHQVREYVNPAGTICGRGDTAAF